MKFKICAVCLIILILSGCNRGPKKYYVGFHKNEQTYYGIHEDYGAPIADTNRNTIGIHYRQHYDKDHPESANTKNGANSSQ